MHCRRSFLIPRLADTTALAAVATGQQVRRDGLMTGEILSRVTKPPSRISAAEWFAARQHHASWWTLIDSFIQRYRPDLCGNENLE